MIFKYCDDHQMPLLNLQDFIKILQYIGNEGKAEIEKEYGKISTTSTGTILRKVIELQQQGADVFFGEVDSVEIDGEGFGADVEVLPATGLFFFVGQFGSADHWFDVAGEGVLILGRSGIGIDLLHPSPAEGILPANTVDAVAVVSAPPEVQRAREVWRRKFGEPAPDAAGRARQMRFLASRGFGTEAIRRVVSGGDD